MPGESWLILTAPTVMLPLSVSCLDKFSGQLMVRSQAAWEEWLAEDNDRFPHPLSKQAMAPACLPPLSLRSTCTSARVHEAWPEQGLEGTEEEHQHEQSVSDSSAAGWMQKNKKKLQQCVSIVISLPGNSKYRWSSIYLLIVLLKTQCIKVLWKQLCGPSAFQCGWVIIT